MGNEGARGGSLSGQIVAGHEFVRLLAVGGMGDVYLARNLELGVLRAIKVIRASQRRDPITSKSGHERDFMMATSLTNFEAINHVPVKNRTLRRGPHRDGRSSRRRRVRDTKSRKIN